MSEAASAIHEREARRLGLHRSAVGSSKRAHDGAGETACVHDQPSVAELIAPHDHHGVFTQLIDSHAVHVR